MECQCDICRGACGNKPGWFRPGEAEQAAGLLRMSFSEFFQAKLGVDWWEDDDDAPETFVLAPGLVGQAAGTEYPGDPYGTCIFLQDGLCQIHAAKPHECRVYDHTKSPEEIKAVKRQIVQEWGTQQEQIVTLLRREPKTKPYWWR